MIKIQSKQKTRIMLIVHYFSIVALGISCSQAQSEQSLLITRDCIGELCLGTSVEQWNENPKIFIRKTEYQYPNGSYIDSVAFVEYKVNDQVVAYSRIPLHSFNDSTKLSFIVTEHRGVKFDNDIGVGMEFKQLKRLVPTANFEREPYEQLGMGQVFDRVKTEEGSWNMYCITYREVVNQNSMDTLITSISINRNR